MTTSIVDIDVNSQEFDKFIKDFKDYQALLSQMPPEWKQLNALLTQASVGVTAGVNNVTKSLKTSTKQVSLFEAAWKKVANTTKQINTTLKDTGSFISRLIPGLGTLSLSVGGVFGVPALGYGLFAGLQHWASGSRTSDLGLGVSQGERVAFGNTFGTYGLDESILGKISEMKNDPSQVGNLAIAAARPMSISEAQHLDPAKFALEAIRAIHDQQNPIIAFRQAQALGLNNAQYNNIRNRSGAELESDIRDYQQRTHKFAIQDRELRAAQDFTRELEDMGNTIKSTVFKDLKPLQGPLMELTHDVNDVLKDFLGSDWLKKHIAELGEELKKFAAYLKSDDFKKDMEHLRQVAIEIADAFMKVVNFINKWFPDSEKPKTPEQKKAEDDDKAKRTIESTGAVVLDTSPDATEANARNERWFRSFKNTVSPVTSAVGSFWSDTLMPGMKNYFTDYGRYGDHSIAKIPVAPASANQTEGELSAINTRLGLPDNSLDRLWYTESKRGKNLFNKRTGAEGNFQFLPGTAKEYGVKIGDIHSEESGLERKLAHLISYYNGDRSKALAAYNWGEGNLDRDIKKHGRDWLNYAPTETQRYVRVILENRTGNDISTISGNMTAY